MSDKIHLKVITHEKIVFEDDIDELYVQASDGRMGILKNHIPVISTLGIGVTKVIKDKVSQCIATMGGVLQFAHNKATILTDIAELECDIEEDLFINSEQSYLELVFNNLISNAIKFTDNKGIIGISLKKINDEYIIKIKDNGCGMDSETGAHIFDKFYQGDTSHSKEGNGLGLALVKKVIDILGGSIDVESEANVGTTFTISIKGE